MEIYLGDQWDTKGLLNIKHGDVVSGQALSNQQQSAVSWNQAFQKCLDLQGQIMQIMVEWFVEWRCNSNMYHMLDTPLGRSYREFAYKPAVVSCDGECYGSIMFYLDLVTCIIHTYIIYIYTVYIHTYIYI